MLTEEHRILPPDFLEQLPSSALPEPIVQGEAVIQSANTLSAGLLIGVKPNDHDPIESFLVAGRLSSLQTGQYHVFIGQSLARGLKVSVGDKVRLMVTSASQFTPLGRIPSQRIFTVAGIYNTGSDVDSQLIVTHIDDAARLLRLPTNTITGWRLFFDDPFVVSELGSKALPDGWKWQDWRDQRGELFQAVRMEKNMMGLMLGLIIGVAAFNIISALIMVVMEKQSEVAILKTQGMTKSQLIGVFMVQGASSGVLGSIIGGGLGVLLATNLNSILDSAGVALLSVGGQLPVLVNPFQIGTVIVMAIALSLLATLFPSYRASSIKPAEALRYE